MMGKALFWSGGATLIAMMQAADLWNCHDSAGRLHRSVVERFFIQREMEAPTVVQVDNQKPTISSRGKSATVGTHGTVGPFGSTNH